MTSSSSYCKGHRNTAGWKKNQFSTFSACTSLSMWITDPESIEVKAKLPVLSTVWSLLPSSASSLKGNIKLLL